MKKLLGILLLIIFSALILSLTVRGVAGNPNSEQLQTPKWRESGPFELSPERGRFALLYSLIEDKSFVFSIDIARFATPDVAILNGKYVSLFAPVVSFVAIPGYLLGRIFGIAQVGAFATIGVFSILNILLIRAIAVRLGVSSFLSSIGAIIFAFATPAFSYAVTLYQHHISTFLILSALYIAIRYKNWISLFAIWFLFAASIPVDYPNLILMLPIALYSTSRIIWIKKAKNSLKLNIKPLNILTFVSLGLPLLLYVWFSMNSYGKPLQLSGTLRSVQAIDVNGLPAESDKIIDQTINKKKEVGPERKKTATGFFKTRNILNGLYLLLISPDRGVLFFTPVLLISLVGAFYLWHSDQRALALIVGVIGSNFLLYSMWGDPWGGWAFGSRYLIPSYALISILISVALYKFRKFYILLPIFIILGIYSIGINTLGALTTNANPPQVEVLALEKLSNRQEKYTPERNWDYLNFQGTKSYAFSAYLARFLTPVQFYWILVASISIVMTSILTIDRFRNK